MKRPGSDITVSEVLNIIKKMPKGGQGGVTKFQALGENNITDIFELTVRLACFNDLDTFSSDRDRSDSSEHPSIEHNGFDIDIIYSGGV